MDLKELHDFKLSDALYFHTDLNQAIFDGDHMNDEVRQQLLIIADDFIEHLGIDDLDVKDITLSGSNAAYSYTKHSDIDLHILVDMTRFTDDDVYRELFDAKKIVYNDQHDIIINGYEVELYVQDANEPVISLGEYSILNNKWIKLPRKRKANLDQVAAKVKFKKIAKLAEFALRSNSYEKIQGVLQTIKKYRQAGLDLNGEFGPENLAFKALRTQGIIKRLYEKLDELHSEKLSLPESKVIRKVKRNDLADNLANEFKRFKTEDYDPNGPPPGPETKPTMPAGTVKVDVSDVYDWYKLGQHISNLKGLGKHDFGKGPPSTILAFGSEEEEHKYIDALKKTGLTTTDIDPVDPNQPKNMPRQKTDPTYNVNEAKLVEFEGVTLKISKHGHVLVVNALDDWGNKTLGHVKFNIGDGKELDPQDLEVDDKYQGQGIAKVMYDYVKSLGYTIVRSYDQTDAGKRFWNKNRGEDVRVWEASGYIPSEKEKNDPRFKTALSVDVKPDSIKKNASAFNFKVSRAGIPPLLRK
jgi:GNAT superfamily N-acetyltransferase